MKENICTLIAVIGAIFTSLVGGWDSAMTTLVIFMEVDFLTGFVTAIIGKSKHSQSGRLNSKAVWVGLAKKFCVLLMVIVAMRIDILLETTYVRDATCIGFCVNELLSIIENTSLMGINYPPAMKKALEVLQKKAGHTNETAQELLEKIEESEENENGSKKL